MTEGGSRGGRREGGREGGWVLGRRLALPCWPRSRGRKGGRGKGREDVPVGVSTKDVLDDNDGLLYYVVNFGLNQLQQHVDAAFGGPLQLDRCPANGADGAADKVDIDFLGVFF